MDTKVEHRDGVYVVSLAGQLDFESADALRAQCRRAFPAKKVIFNLQELNFVGSSGLTPFLELLGEMKKNLGKDVKLCAVNRDFLRLFEGGDLAQIEVYENEDKAHNAFIFSQFIASLGEKGNTADGAVRRVRSFGMDGEYHMEEDGE